MDREEGWDDGMDSDGLAHICRKYSDVALSLSGHIHTLQQFCFLHEKAWT